MADHWNSRERDGRRGEGGGGGGGGDKLISPYKCRTKNPKTKLGLNEVSR